MEPEPTSETPPQPDEIARCAYLIWIAEDRPEGYALQHWLQAETQLHAAFHHEKWMKP